MSSTDYQPTSWVLEAFGADSMDIAAALARAAASAQADGHDAETGSRLRTNEAYGAATWISLAHHVAAELEDLGAEVVQPAGCRYRVAAINTTLMLAIKLAASSKGIDDMKIWGSGPLAHWAAGLSQSCCAGKPVGAPQDPMVWLEQVVLNQVDIADLM